MGESAEKSASALVSHLEGYSEAYDIRTHKGTVDFTIGDPELWPSSLNDDELNCIRSSSVSFESLIPDEDGKVQKTNFRTGGSIHLPPASEELWEELEEEAQFDEPFALVNGTFRLGSLTPPPTGVCTPHLVITETVDINRLLEELYEAFRLYREVYNHGEEVIKTQGEEQ